MNTKQPSFLLRVLDALKSLENATDQGCSATEITKRLCRNYKCDGNVYSTVEMQVQISLNKALEQGMVEKSGKNKYILVPSVVHFMKSCMPESILRRRTIKGCEILKKTSNKNKLIRPLKMLSKKKCSRRLKKQSKRKRKCRMQKTSKRREVVNKTGQLYSNYCRLDCVGSSTNITKAKFKQTSNTVCKQKVNKLMNNTLHMKQKELFATALKKMKKGEIGSLTTSQILLVKCPDCSRQIVPQRLSVCSHCSRKFIIAKKDFNT